MSNITGTDQQTKRVTFFGIGVQTAVLFHGDYTESTFHDETVVPAAPHNTEEYAENARRHGYGDGSTSFRADLSREHEVLHHLLAIRLGYQASPTLWAVAHPDADNNMSVGAQHFEEQIVLDFQKHLNGLPASDLIVCIFPDLAYLIERASALLRGNVTWYQDGQFVHVGRWW